MLSDESGTVDLVAISTNRVTIPTGTVFALRHGPRIRVHLGSEVFDVCPPQLGDTVHVSTQWRCVFALVRKGESPILK